MSDENTQPPEVNPPAPAPTPAPVAETAPTPAPQPAAAAPTPPTAVDPVQAPAPVSTPAPAPAPQAPAAEIPVPQRQMNPQQLADYGRILEQQQDLDKTPVDMPEHIKNATQIAEIFEGLDDVSKDGGPTKQDAAVISIPGNTAAWIENELLKLPTDDFSDSPEGTYWINTIENGETFTTPRHGWFGSCANRVGATWGQNVPSERGPLALSAPSFNDISTGLATGPRAVLRMRSLLGMGTVNFIPCWHSGFWLHLKVPSEGALLELNRKITEEKISLGRQTYGMAFANSSSFFTSTLMDFAMEHIYDSSFKADGANIRDHISMLDIPTIVWGLATLIWPRGFPYARSVIRTTTTGKVNVVLKGKVNTTKLFWTDTSMLTDWQKNHMSKKQSNSMSLTEVQRYLSEFTLKGRRIELNDKMALTLRIPSVTEYLASGQRWINGIVNMVDQAFSISPGSGSRDTYITEQGRATNVRQYAHLIESIDTDGMIVNDITTIESMLDVLSGRNDLRKPYFDGTKKFVEDSTISMIAVPVTEPEDVAPLPRFPHLLPIDAASVFLSCSCASLWRFRTVHRRRAYSLLDAYRQVTATAYQLSRLWKGQGRRRHQYRRTVLGYAPSVTCA